MTHLPRSPLDLCEEGVGGGVLGDILDVWSILPNTFSELPPPRREAEVSSWSMNRDPSQEKRNARFYLKCYVFIWFSITISIPAFPYRNALTSGNFSSTIVNKRSR
ncbi:hypothetical protein BDM02DRAFT_3128302 [Thelephora ganbajun]|uniref:Uncharacterized protein n=1 Tax=Thelephora ganbajun TaxID=370292 RepID=A0ACB6ZIT8_THEGA|nr:hypothetical protein BDM02DRAFT_3128302 [Thelephora ganbajun]